MWTALLLVCNTEGLCKAGTDNRLWDSKEECEVSIALGADFYFKKGMVVKDWKCISWVEDTET